MLLLSPKAIDQLLGGIDLPKEKRVEIGLTYIYGIGRTSASKILKEAGINPDMVLLKEERICT